MHYLFNGQSRLSLWGFGPNDTAFHLACLSVMLLAVLAALIRRCPDRARWSRWRRGGGLCLLVGAIVCGYGVVATYSRGGLVCLLAGYSTIFISDWFYRRADSGGTAGRGLIVPLGMASASVLVFVFCFGLHLRVTPEFVAADRSIGNRLLLWNGAAEMLAAAPFGGWGHLQSGMAFCNWFESPLHTEVYYGMVNTFLELGVNYGVIPVAALCTIMGCAVLCGAMARDRSAHGGWVVAGQVVSAGAASWVAGAIFTNFSYTSGAWIIPLLCLGLIGAWLAGKSTRGLLVRPLACSMAATIVVMLGVVTYGEVLARGSAVRVHPERIWHRIDVAKAGETWIVLGDQAILGRFPGKMLKPFSERAKVAKIYVLNSYLLDAHRIEDEVKRLQRTQTITGILACGGAAGAAIRLTQNDQSLVLLHPVARDDLGALPAKAKVFLPEIDENGGNLFWTRVAAKEGPAILYSRGTGQELIGEIPPVF